MTTVHRWTGLEARSLRLSLRMSVRSFAEHLGVGVRTVSKWEKLREATVPRPDTQAILDTALAQADTATLLRFETHLSEAGLSLRTTGLGRPLAGTSDEEYESWTDDLDRAVVALSQQNFVFADTLLRRWLSHSRLGELDDRGLYLFARSTALLGDVQRDQGFTIGPLSAQRSYTEARSLFARLGNPRRVAQLDLSLAVVTEMSGELKTAARRYEALAVDDRLSRRDRARARLWVGTTLSKEGEHDYATGVMRVATREFEELGEPGDWSVAHQKLALAHRGVGELDSALRFLDIARGSDSAASPMNRVRLDTAQGHVLLSDPATRAEGLRLLDRTAEVAARYGLSHQLRSIESIRTTGTPRPSPRRSNTWRTTSAPSPRSSGSRPN